MNDSGITREDVRRREGTHTATLNEADIGDPRPQRTE